MKQLLIFTSILFLSVNSQAQLEVVEDESELIGEVAPMGQTTAKIIKEGDEFYFMYRDLKFKQVIDFKGFHFTSIDELYTFIIDGIKEKRKDKEDISLDDNNLTIDFNRFLGVGTVEILHKHNSTIGVTSSFTEKQINQLFGKE